MVNVPFEPKCLAAGYGWIALGGADNGECAFIRLFGRATDSPGNISTRLHHSDVDSALPVDLEAARRPSPSWTTHGVPRSDTGRWASPEVLLPKFGGTIVNSVTIHRFPGDENGLGYEDVVVLRYPPDKVSL